MAPEVRIGVLPFGLARMEGEPSTGGPARRGDPVEVVGSLVPRRGESDPLRLPEKLAEFARIEGALERPPEDRHVDPGAFRGSPEQPDARGPLLAEVDGGGDSLPAHPVERAADRGDLPGRRRVAQQTELEPVRRPDHLRDGRCRWLDRRGRVPQVRMAVHRRGHHDPTDAALSRLPRCRPQLADLDHGRPVEPDVSGPDPFEVDDRSFDQHASARPPYGGGYVTRPAGRTETTNRGRPSARHGPVRPPIAGGPPRRRPYGGRPVLGRPPPPPPGPDGSGRIGPRRPGGHGGEHRPIRRGPRPASRSRRAGSAPTSRRNSERRLRAERVDLEGLETVRGERSPTCLIVEDGRGGQMTLIDQGAMGDAADAVLPLGMLHRYPWVHLTTGDPAYQLRMMDAARSEGSRVAADPAQEVHYRWGARDLRRLLGGSEIFFGNESEASATARLFGMSAAARLTRLVPLVVVTRGTKGARAYGRHRHRRRTRAETEPTPPGDRRRRFVPGRILRGLAPGGTASRRPGRRGRGRDPMDRVRPVPLAAGPMRMRPFGRLLPADEALARLLAATVPVGRRETVPVEEALGRRVARPVVARHAVPPFRRASWDGYAVQCRSTGGASVDRPVGLRLAGEVYAETPSRRRLEPGTAVAIATGGPLPPGADGVVIFEDVRVESGEVVVSAPVRVGDRIAEVGDDFPKGSRLAQRDDLLTPARLGAIAAAGIPTVEVWGRPRVAIVPNGNELRRPGEPLPFGAIHESNNAALAALARGFGAEVTTHDPIPDDEGAIEAVVRRAARDVDLLLVTGGSSVGEHDYLPAIFPRLGRLLFHGIAVRPGEADARGPGRPDAGGRDAGTSDLLSCERTLAHRPGPRPPRARGPRPVERAVGRPQRAVRGPELRVRDRRPPRGPGHPGPADVPDLVVDHEPPPGERVRPPPAPPRGAPERRHCDGEAPPAPLRRPGAFRRPHRDPPPKG